MAIEKFVYGSMNGRDVHGFIITNNKGTKAQIIEKGATLDKIIIEDKNGKFIDVLSGHDTLDGHINRSDYQGVVVGQYANRIKNGAFTIDGIEYSVTKNEKGVTCLHGGGEYSSAHWLGTEKNENSVEFTYTSPDGKEGFPGNVDISVIYTLDDEDNLSIEYRAVSDKKTVINLTNHAYFNLNGYDGGDILKHTLRINADRFTAIDEMSIPTGELPSVEGTPFDFRTPKEIGKDIDENFPQLINGMGYDHNFCIADYDGTLKEIATATGDKSGITMTVKTTEPGVQLYTGNFLDGSIIGKGKLPLEKRSAFCLETQVYPDSPNHPEWPSCIYEAGQQYKSITIFAFSKS